MTWLAEGPRGRRLCWELLMALELLPASVQQSVRLMRSDSDRWDHSSAREIATALGELDVDSLRATDRDLFRACGMAVDSARYWQAPDGTDRCLADSAVRDALGAAASTVADLAPAWWFSGLDPEKQVETSFDGDDTGSLDRAGARLAMWRADTLRDEESAKDRPTDREAAFSGYWWSAPCLSRLPSSTRCLPGAPSVELLWREDSRGDEAAHCRSLAVPADVRVYEVDGAAALVALVDRYPLEVTRSRRHDWWRAAGATGPLLIPDYCAISQDYDAVHVSVAAYLSTAGRPLPTPGGATTVLAGWDPDKTWWLTDVGPADVPWNYLIRHEDRWESGAQGT